ncbi:hypothetical protein Tco_1020753, partial [Tanacetum coccineum]
MSIDEELAQKLHEEEHARFNSKQDAEIARQLQEEIDIEGQEKVIAEDDQSHDIDWSDPTVIIYHTLQNRPRSEAEVRKNMCMYLKNQGGYKLSYFKGMSYEDIRPIFEKKIDDSSKPAGGSRKKSLARKRAGEKQSEESTKRKKMEDHIEKEELKAYLDILNLIGSTRLVDE